MQEQFSNVNDDFRKMGADAMASTFD